jgi:hypothetical protein
MAIEVLGTGQDDGTAVVKSTTEKIHLYGGTAVSQAATIADIASIATDAFDGTVSTGAIAVNALIVKINTLLDDLSDIGIHASA